MLKVWYSEQYSLLATEEINKSKTKSIFLGIVLLFFSFVLISYFSWYSFNQPPEKFPANEPIEIEPGMRTQEIANHLKEKSVIKSALLFNIYLKLFSETKTLQAGTYQFVKPLTMQQVILDMREGNYQPDLLKVTHTEGRTAEQLSELLGGTFSSFSAEEFFVIAEPFEGKLFPETYFIPPDYTAEEVLDILLQTYDDVIKDYKTVIAEHNLTETEIIILASILEREANSEESMRMVSGILQNRLAIGMALQADATIGYILDKPLSELTAEDLEIDSSYNTYLYPGLPPTPIGNPGRQAIEAVLDPTPSNNMYYITGNDGNFYYAETFAEHRQNIAKYLQ